MAEAQLTNMNGTGGSGEDDGQNNPDKQSNSGLEDSKMAPSKENVEQSSGEEEEEFSSASTAATSSALTPMTAGSLGSSHPMELDRRRDQLQNQMVFLVMVTTITLLGFVMTVIPLNILVAFGMFATSAGLLSYTSFQRLLLEYQNVLAGDGFAQFLPVSLVQQLTETSLHQFLRDDTFAREWGFLGLYFVPGLTEDQLNDYIRRLAPDRQAYLNRPGMGYFVGDGFMRAMVGERRWRQHAIVTNVPSIEHPINQELVIRSRGLDFDSDTDSHGSTLVGPAASREVSENNIIQREGEELLSELAMDADIIINALSDGISNYLTMATVAASQFARDQILEPVAGIATMVGLVTSASVTLLSLGTGIWQYTRPNNTGQRQSLPISGFLLSATVLGSLSTGVMLYARSAIRKSGNCEPRKPPPKVWKPHE